MKLTRNQVAQSFLGSVSALALLATGCGKSTVSGQPLSGNEAFIAVKREVDPGTMHALQSALSKSGGQQDEVANESFYLGINKKELGQKYFLSAYLKQYFPGAVQVGAARSLGTYVVSFRIQNNKLFVFDVSDGKDSSDTFTPEVILDAYPLIDPNSTPLRNTPGSDNYVVVDPSAGLNKFNLVADALSARDQNNPFQVELSFMQRFRPIKDGATFEQVFTGSSSLPDDWKMQFGQGAFSASGTLGLSVRKYYEGEGFTETAPPKATFFFTNSYLIKNTGQTIDLPVKWNIKRGMKPIQWVISDQAKKWQDDPSSPYKGIDIVGAMKKGIENWNKAFGFKVLEARVASPDDSYADDDTNYLIFDADPTYGAAFANWRINPNTGELRGASVYFNRGWLDAGLGEFSDDPADRAKMGTREKPNFIPSLTWGGGQNRSPALCNMWTPDYRNSEEVKGSEQYIPGSAPRLAPTHASPAAAGLTKIQKIEKFIAHVVVHEVGHTLGLRHNFKGSLEPISSSVMDYVLDDQAIFIDEPQPYDVAAVSYLYGLSKDQPTDAFCTDEDTVADPDCTRFDAGADPLNDYYAPNYNQVLGDFLTGANPNAPNNSLNGVAKYIRMGTPQQKPGAWDLLWKGSAAAQMVDSSLTAEYIARADFMARRILGRLYLDPPEMRGDFVADPPVDINALARVELAQTLANQDSSHQSVGRSYATRRLAVDVLKKIGDDASQDIVCNAVAGLTAEETASGSDVNRAHELRLKAEDACNHWH